MWFDVLKTGFIGCFVYIFCEMCFVCHRKLDWYCLLPKGLEKWPMFLPTYIYGCVEKRMSYIVLYIKFSFSGVSIIYWLELSISFIYSASINLAPTNLPFHGERKGGSLNANEMVTKYPSPINWILCVFISSNMCLYQPKKTYFVTLNWTVKNIRCWSFYES